MTPRGANRSRLPVSTTGSPAPTKQTLTVERYRTSLNYELSGRSGRAIGTIEVPTAGQYTITSTGDPVTIAIGPSVARGIVGLVLAVLAAGAALLALIVTGIVMGVRRASARR